MKTIQDCDLHRFKQSLCINEKSKATVAKYVREVRRLADYLAGGALTKQALLSYRDHLREMQKAQTVNGALSAINAYLDFYGWTELKVKLLKVQRQVFLPEERELTQAEYKRLLSAAQRRGQERLYLLMLTLCGTGIRISELKYITVEAAEMGRAEINLKGKNRVILLQKDLRGRLLRYAKRRGIACGCIFQTRTGRPMDRSNVCHDLKRLCKEAGVAPCKVYPHSFRHLFARTFYAVEKNLAHLADVLGHSRIETTRIYVAVSAAAHERILNRMKLVV